MTLRWEPGRRTLACVAVAALSLTPGCAGVAYGIASVFRSDPDEEALDAERRDAVRAELATTVGADALSQYRGEQGDGVYRGSPLSLDWPEAGPPELWRVAVGRAYSSVAVAGGLAVTLEQRRDREAVVAFVAETGELVWEHSWPARFEGAMSKEGPRATPAIAGDAVVVVGATGMLRCLALATGELRWGHDLLAGDANNLFYGLSASPRIWDDLVIVQGATTVCAFERASGTLRWQALSEELAYATPQLGRLLGDDTLIVSTAVRIVGLDPNSGTEHWSVPWEVFSGLSNTQPIVFGPDQVLLSAGYGAGAQLVRLELDAGTVEPSIVWQSGRFKTRFNEPVLVGEYAFGLDEGTLTCIAVATGRRAWKGGRYGYGQLLAAGEHLIVMGEDGTVHLVEADPEAFVEVASFEALDDGNKLNLPAIARGLLYVRSDLELACYDLRAPSEPRP